MGFSTGMCWRGPTKVKANKLEVCLPELVLNETRPDQTGTHFLNWRYWDKTTFFWSPHSRKIREINETGKQPVPNAGTEPVPGR